ncbi:MAG: cell division protein FtsQ/DivIB [Bacteroidota bacterium]|jgi:cell division protein FtsQ|nr:cell division protein FtsQ [Bacteroidota bacterium]MCA4900194.1 cell division protein FtsQ [Cytophagales bacterium]MCE2959052.1 cell division protein FtsQ/DivIB [Flammeovirgaceae bacterium]
MKTKFNIRKEIKIATVLIGLSFLIAFAERKQGGAVCKNVSVEIENLNENHFLDEADVMKLVETSGETIKGIGIDRINLKDIEKKLKYDKHILDAELFGDLKGNLVVNVELRRPIARIVQSDAPDAYIAEDGVIMPVSEKYTSRVLLISGYVKPLLESEDLNKSEEGKQLLEMIEYINANRFWKAQVAQLDIDRSGRIDIFPQVTGQRVEFGKPENIEMKFKKLMIFYKEILPARGWTRYERVNLEYEGQVIAE